MHLHSKTSKKIPTTAYNVLNTINNFVSTVENVKIIAGWLAVGMSMCFVQWVVSLGPIALHWSTRPRSVYPVQLASISHTRAVTTANLVQSAWPLQMSRPPRRTSAIAIMAKWSCPVCSHSECRSVVHVELMTVVLSLTHSLYRHFIFRHFYKYSYWFVCVSYTVEFVAFDNFY